MDFIKVKSQKYIEQITKFKDTASKASKSDTISMALSQMPAQTERIKQANPATGIE
jgi:hypothetical protein